MRATGQGPVLDLAHSLVQGLRQGAGGNMIGFCPIHGETMGRSTPSFSFNILTGQWNCFAGCGGGGLPQLLKKLKKSDAFVDRTMERVRPFLKPVAIKKVVAAGGGAFRTEYPLPERVLGLYEYAPEALLRDGFDEELLRENDVGFDVERERVVYAIRDLGGALAGLVGRGTRADERGKYIVYEQEVRDMGFRGYWFNNREYLWGWETVYPSVYFGKAKGPVCITEGYKARLWLVQHGFPLTVALMGTSLGIYQQAFLERLGVPLVLCLDNDPAGRKGTSKICHKLRGLPVAVMRYPFPEVPKLQPDDLTRNEIADSINHPFTVRQWRSFYHEFTE